MNVLIVLPRITSRTDGWYMFPTGIAYVTAALKQRNICNVFTINLNHREGTVFDNLKKEIETHQIDLVATGGLTFQIDALQDVVKSAKRIKPGIMTAVGGGFMTSDPLVAMHCIPQIDIGMIGEGEVVIGDMIDALQTSTPLDTVAGLIFRDQNGDIHYGPPSVQIENLDTLPFPDYDAFDFDKLLELKPTSFSIYQNHTAVLVTSRSCPFNCTFCFHPQGQTYRQRSLDNVFAELDWLIEKYHIRGIHIVDELFAADKTRLREFCSRIRKYGLKWWAQMRVTQASKENLQLMKDSGCVQVGFGIESADNQILRSMKKHITIEQVEIALENAYQVGISGYGGLIFGDAEETVETAENSLKWWSEHQKYWVTLSTIIVFPGSGLWEYAKRNGYLPTLEDQVAFVRAGCPKINISKMSDSEYNNLCMRIAELTQKSMQPIPDPQLRNIDWNGCQLCDVTGSCVRCGMENQWKSVYIATEGRFFTCNNCGQSHRNSFSEQYYPNVVKHLRALSEEYERVALWGQGRHMAQIMGAWQEELGVLPIHYIDKSISKKGHYFYRWLIHSPDSLEEYRPQVLILTVGERNMFSVKNALDEFTQQLGMPVAQHIYTLADLMNPDFLDTAL